MPFDISKLIDFVEVEIKRFAEIHRSEHFYAFTIDANLLCLNSEEEFAKTLSDYRTRAPEYYSTSSDVESLRANTGDWAYQGFAQFDEESGFDQELYDLHYDIGLDVDEGAVELSTTEYARAMDEVIRNLKKGKAFENLKRTPDFKITRVEHSY